MSLMPRCPSCDGFIPAAAPSCPHCDTAPAFPPRPRARRGLARTLLTLAGSGAMAITLMACYGAPPFDDPCWDNDSDGYFPACYDEACDPEDVYCDCDDADPSIHPEAKDPKGDGVDSNCDGVDGVLQR